MRFAARYGRAGVELTGKLEDSAAKTLVGIKNDIRYQRTLVEAYEKDPDVSAADVGQSLRRYREFEGATQARYTSLVSQTGPRGLRSFSDLTDAELRDFLDSGMSPRDQRVFVSVAGEETDDILSTLSDDTKRTLTDANLVKRYSDSSGGPVGKAASNVDYRRAELLWNDRMASNLAAADLSPSERQSVITRLDALDEDPNVPDRAADRGLQLLADEDVGTDTAEFIAETPSDELGDSLSYRDRVVADGGDPVDYTKEFQRLVIDTSGESGVGDFPSTQFYKSYESMDPGERERFTRNVVEEDIPLRGLPTYYDELNGFDEEVIAGSKTTTFDITRQTQADAPENTVRGDIIYPNPGETVDIFSTSAKRSYGDAEAGEYVDTDPDNVEKSWEGLSDSGDRGEFVEKKLTPTVLEEQYNLEVLCVDTGCGTGANGIDVIAWDPNAGDDGELVIVESKWTSNDKAATTSVLEGNRDGTPPEAIQMTNPWILDSWDEAQEYNNVNLLESIDYQQEIIDATDGAESLEAAVNDRIRDGNYERAYFFTSNSRNKKTLSDDSTTVKITDGGGNVINEKSYYLNDIFDRVYHFKAGDVIDDD